jgi:SET domain
MELINNVLNKKLIYMKILGNLPLKLQLGWSSINHKFHVPMVYASSLCSSSSIPKGTEILEVRDWISGKEISIIDRLKASLIKDVLDYITSINPTTPNLLNRLQLAYQVSVSLRDKSSIFYDYANSFPTTQDNFPIYWNDLTYTSCVPLRLMIGEEYFLYRNSYDKIFDLNKKALSNVTFEEFTWIHTVVNDRSIDFGDCFGLVPIADTFPHSFKPNTRVFKDCNVIKVISIEDIPAKTVLTRNYGEHDNYTYMFRHGFIPDNNIYHKFPVYPDTLPEWLEVASKLRINDRSILENRGNSKRYSMSSFKKNLFNAIKTEGLAGAHFTPEPPAIDMESTFRVFFLNETDLDGLGVKDYAEAENIDFTKQINDKNEKNVRTMILKCALMYNSILTDAFVGTHPYGKKIEDIDKSLIEKHVKYYGDLLDYN